MPAKDKRIDAYIEKSAPFARPVMKHLRELIHKANPAVEETIKWGMPSFDYKGPYCHMASFKQHCVFGFWKSGLIKDTNGYLGERASKGGEAMGNLGRVTGLQDLPPDKVIIDFLKQAAKLNDDNIKLPAPKKEKKEAEVPDYFMEALAKNKKALATFEQFSPSNKKEYVLWVTEAKTDATRETRMATAVEWMAEGKSRLWKYQKK